MTARTLLLLRHARAEHGSRGSDHERELTKDGRAQAAAVGLALAATGQLPDLVLCSSAVRTRQTWAAVAAAADLHVGMPALTLSDALYSAGPAEMLAAIRAVDDGVHRLLVVGHEPTISELASLLASPGSDPAAVAQVTIGVPTASMSELEVPSSWDGLTPQGARLVALHRR